MKHRLNELAMRRQMLVLRSERLREELLADQYAVRHSLSNIERTLSTVRRLGSPLLLIGAGALALRSMRRVRAVSWGARAMMLFSLARRALVLTQIIRAVARARAQAQAYAQAHSNPQ